MRKKISFVFAAFLVVLLTLNSNSNFAEAYNGSIIVYVTETGELYHRDGCTYLKSKIPMTLEDASKSYGRCSRCDPPILGQDREDDAEPYLSEWRGNYSGTEKSEGNKISDVKNDNNTEEHENYEFLFYAKLVIPILLIAFIFFAVKHYIERREQIKIHEARCRGDLPGGVPGMPFGTIIGEDGLPRQIRSKYAWGSMYTFYISRNGKVFHRDPFCSRGTLIAVHAIYLKDRPPCKRCKPIKPDLSWFMPYFQKEKKTTISSLPENGGDCQCQISKK